MFCDTLGPILWCCLFRIGTSRSMVSAALAGTSPRDLMGSEEGRLLRHRRARRDAGRRGSFGLEGGSSSSWRRIQGHGGTHSASLWTSL